MAVALFSRACPIVERSWDSDLLKGAENLNFFMTVHWNKAVHFLLYCKWPFLKSKKRKQKPKPALLCAEWFYWLLSSPVAGSKFGYKHSALIVLFVHSWQVSFLFPPCFLPLKLVRFKWEDWQDFQLELFCEGTRWLCNRLRFETTPLLDAYDVYKIQKVYCLCVSCCN